ncbi:MAG: right-handed parallel beta-helix repeat-containing protein [Phycisphaerales bacterium]|nr:right-handed parallel beta-helix repeat-containing protein [Phycisphaerales bacterium]
MSGQERIRVIAIVLSLAGVARADVRYVDRNAPPSGDGSTWCDAFVDLQDALAVSQFGDEIRVADGTYLPDQGTGDILMSFQIPTGVRLLGGYAGCGGPIPDARDPSLNVTVLSGDLEGNDGPDFTNYDDNSFIVVRTSQAGPATLIDGFTITGGNANGPLNHYDRGGGMYNWLGGPTVRQCVFRGNAATTGGAVNTDASDTTFIDCEFLGNQGVTGGGAIFGYNSMLTVRACRFVRNQAVAGVGGAIFANNSELAIDDVDFESNGAQAGGGVGAYSNTRGYVACATFTRNQQSALYLSSAGDIELRDCEFTDNAGNNAGAAYYLSSSPRFIRCAFTANTGASAGAISVINSSSSFEECLFDGNLSVLSAGGALLVQGSDLTTLDRCLLQGNIAERGGAMYVAFNSTVVVNRSTLLNNSTTQDDGGGIYATTDVNLRMVGCRLLGNSSIRRAGGLYVSRYAIMNAVSCEFCGNHAEDDGGAVYNDFDSLSRFSGCTFSQNTADFDGDGIFNLSADPILDNCVLWNNGGLGSTNQLYDTGGSPQVQHTCIPGSWGGAGNISADPVFVDANGADDIAGTLDDDLRLASQSPCINAGSSGLLPADTTDADYDGNASEPTPIDAAGHARVLCGQLDMGAHEAGIGDADCDGSVALADYLQWNACMTGPGGGPYPPGCNVFDFELDHDVDAADFAAWQRALSIP